MTNTFVSCSHRFRSGVTLIEAMIAIAILAILVGMVAPVVSRQTTHSRVNAAAQAIVSDLENAVSVAGRQRRPIRVTVDPAQHSIVTTDRASGQTITRHAYGAATDYKVEVLSLSPASLDILPHGATTSAATVTVGTGAYSRRVTVTRAGLVRLQP